MTPNKFCPHCGEELILSEDELCHKSDGVSVLQCEEGLFNNTAMLHLLNWLEDKI